MPLSASVLDLLGYVSLLWEYLVPQHDNLRGVARSKRLAWMEARDTEQRDSTPWLTNETKRCIDVPLAFRLCFVSLCHGVRSFLERALSPPQQQQQQERQPQLLLVFGCCRRRASLSPCRVLVVRPNGVIHQNYDIKSVQQCRRCRVTHMHQVSLLCSPCFSAVFHFSATAPVRSPQQQYLQQQQPQPFSI